jgi:hypothetical protein
MVAPVPRIPPPLKRLILPFWNAGHRFAWAAGEFLDAVRHRRFERCDVCGRFGPMLYRRRVIPPRLAELWGLSPRLAEALARKESSDCPWCGAKLRVRRLARALLDAYLIGSPPRSAGSVAEWVKHPEVQPLRIAEINIIEGLHEFLAKLPGRATSDYREGATPGSVVDGVRHEDLTGLTYPDATFDVVLTSETLEHVPDLGAALSEVRRALVPGGRHLFTVPLLPGVPKTYARAVVGPGGAIEHRATAICHPGGDIGYPVFTEFGADLPEILRGAGFAVEVRFGPTTEDDLAQVFVCRKEPGGASAPPES